MEPSSTTIKPPPAIDFGSAPKGGTPPQVVFTVRNLGTGVLSLGTLTVPSSYSIVEGVSPTLAGGASDTFTVRMNTGISGTKSGQISLVNSDDNENPYNFAITGFVIPDTTKPTADVVDVTPDPYTGPLSSVTINFSEMVFGFDTSDITLTRNGEPIALTAAQTLTNSGNVQFTLNNLADLTGVSGTYVLTVTGGLTDGSSNPLEAPASDTFKIQTNTFRGGDAYYLRRSGDGTKVEVFENVDPVGAPTYSLTWASLTSLTFDAQGGTNGVTIDYANGTPVPAEAGSFTYLATGTNNILQLKNGGTFTFFADAAINTPSLSVLATGTDIVFNTTQHLDALSLDASDASIADNGKNLIVSSLSLTNDATLDLSANSLAIDYNGSTPIGSSDGSAYTGITGLLAGGTLFSSAADGAHYSLGIAESCDALGLAAGETQDWRGETIDATAVLVKYTYTGDDNLDGTVNGDDYFQIDSHVQQSGSVFGYFTGDLDLDGDIDGDDYFLIDGNALFAQGAPVL